MDHNLLNELKRCMNKYSLSVLERDKGRMTILPRQIQGDYLICDIVHAEALGQGKESDVKLLLDNLNLDISYHGKAMR